CTSGGCGHKCGSGEASLICSASDGSTRRAGSLRPRPGGQRPDRMRVRRGRRLTRYTSRYTHPAEKQGKKSKKSEESVAPEWLKSALPEKKLVRKSKKSPESRRLS